MMRNVDPDFLFKRDRRTKRYSSSNNKQTPDVELSWALRPTPPRDPKRTSGLDRICLFGAPMGTAVYGCVHWVVRAPTARPHPRVWGGRD